MARPWRIQYEDAVYHIASRGNNRQDIFLIDEDRQDFLELLGQTSERFNLEIFAFCLMSNHFHLFLRTPEANLAPAMHWLNATYSIHFLHRHHRSGHLLQGRYKAVLVLGEEHWQILSFYIHLNPVRAKMVEDPGDYAWSSFLDYTRARSRYKWLCREEVLSGYPGRKALQRRRYRRECLELAGKEPKFWKEMRNGLVIGPREALERLAEKYQPSGSSRYVTDYHRISRPEVELEEELKRVSGVFKVRVEDLKRRSRYFPARLAAYYHLVEHCGMSKTRVANYLGISPMGVSQGIKRLKDRMVDDLDLEKKINSLKFKV